jgi:outer membrane protein TolC
MHKSLIREKDSWGKTICLFVAFIVSVVGFGPITVTASEPIPSGQFGSLLTLEEAVTRALKDHGEVKRAFARLRKEEALYKGKLSEFLPKIKADAVGGMATGEKRVLTYLDTGIEQPLFQGGKAIAEKKMQKAVVEIEKLKLDDARLEVELMVRVLYAQVLEEKELTRIAQGEVKELFRQYERIKKLADKEILPRHEFFRMETLLESAKHALVKHKETYDYLHTVLRETVGIGEGESLDLEPLGEIPELEGEVGSYLETARRHDPVYKTRELKVQEKRFEKRALQAERFPHIGLSARWNRFKDVFVDTDRFIVGIEGKWNIWDFGRLGSQISAKEHEIEETEWEGELKIREHEKEISRLFHEARAVRQKIRMQEALLKEREEIYKNEKTRLIAGEKGTGELVDAFLALEEAKIVRIQAVTEYRIQIARLERKTAFAAINDTPPGNEVHFEDQEAER